MSTLSYTYSLTDGTTASAAQVQTSFDEAKTVVNGSLDSTNLTAATATLLGLSRGATSSRGKSIIATSESRTGTVTSYGTMPTADQVSVTLPTDGLLYVAYQATWSETVTGAARAAIFIGANQVKGPQGGNPSPVVYETSHGNTATQNQPLYTTAIGLDGTAGTAGWSDVATGQILGQGPTTIFAAAGTYTVSIQFKATSGNVFAVNRKLWVWTAGF